MAVAVTCAIWGLVAAPRRRRRHELVAAQINANNNSKIKWKCLYIYKYASPSESTAPTVCARVQTPSTTTPPPTTTTTTTTARRTTAVPSRRSVAHETPQYYTLSTIYDMQTTRRPPAPIVDFELILFSILIWKSPVTPLYNILLLFGPRRASPTENNIRRTPRLNYYSSPRFMTNILIHCVYFLLAVV